MFEGPQHDCALCPRLCDFRFQNRVKFPDKLNAPVPSFGDITSRLLIVGLAPGLKGANFSGRPFTGDYAGDLLYSTLIKYGFAQGVYKADPKDGLRLIDCRIANAVRCVPPENKPTPFEMAQCLPFLKDEISEMRNLKVILTLGQISHQSTLKALGEKISSFKFAHNQTHRVKNIAVINSYHCSRYNTQTKRLTETQFHNVFDSIQNNL